MTGKEILQKAQTDFERIAADRHFLHAHPETGFALKGTLAYVKQALIDMGYEPVPCGKAGLVALAGGRKPGKVFLLRADMDALPIQESDADFASLSSLGNSRAAAEEIVTVRIMVLVPLEISETTGRYRMVINSPA